ncbi:MAG: hypothetical protein HY062_07010 [Bacteroidetes bacterium]|nr:hypothetical protein [Bacteroidota bacterium]
MKTIVKRSLVLLATGIFLSINSNASENEKPKSTTRLSVTEAHQTIKEHIKFPNLLMHFDQEEKVNVVFTVNESGEVNLVVANTSNDILKKSIESQFLKLKLNNLKANNAYSIVFNFKTI